MLSNLINNVTDKVIQIRGYLEKNSANARDLITKLIDTIDFAPELFDLQAGESTTIQTDTILSELEDQLSDVFDKISSSFATMVDSEGELFSPHIKEVYYSEGTEPDELLIGDIDENDNFKTWITITSAIDSEHHYLVLSAADAFMNTTDDVLNFNNLTDMFTGVMDTIGITTVISEATDLLEKGELNANNFIQMCSDRIANADGAVTSAYSTILNAVKNSDSSNMAINLFDSIKTIIGGWANATTRNNDGSIQFSSTDYFVSSSIFFDISSIISIASTVLSTVMSFINPVLGFIVNGIGSAINTAIEYINNNDTNVCKYTDSAKRDGDNFAVPVFQKDYSGADLSYIPSSIINNLLEYGFCRTNNNFLTLYYWVDKKNDQGDITHVKCEGYVSALTSSLIGDDVGGQDPLWKTHVLNSVSDDNSTGYTVTSTGHSSDILNLQRILNDWGIVNQNHYDYETYVIKGYGSRRSYIDFKHVRSILDNLASLSYIILNDYDGLLVGTTQFHPYSEFTSVDYGDVNAFIPSECNNPTLGALKQLLLFLSTYKSERTNSYESYFTTYDLEHGTDNGPTEYVLSAWINITNWLVPSIRYFLSDYTYSASTPTGNKDIMTIWFNSFSDDITITGLGNGYQFRIINPRSCSRDQYVIPPSSSVSVWVKIAVAAIATAAIVIAIGFATLKIKRWVSYKMEKYRAMLKSKADDVSSMSMAEYNKFRRETRFYNRFLGKLSGSTFDMSNGWFDATSGSNSDSGTALDALMGVSLNTSESGELVGMPDIMRVIKGTA